MASTAAIRVKARALLPLIRDNEGAIIQEHKLLEVVRSLLFSRVEDRVKIARELGHMAEQAMQRQEAVITSAAPLSKETKDILLKKLAEKHPQLLTAKWLVEPQLLGGFTIQVGDIWYDSSVANDLSTLREQLSQ